MLALRLKPQTEKKLERLARKTGRTKSFYAREAIEKHIADLELAYTALRRKKNPSRIYSATEMRRAVGL